MQSCLCKLKVSVPIENSFKLSGRKYSPRKGAALRGRAPLLVYMPYATPTYVSDRNRKRFPSEAYALIAIFQSQFQTETRWCVGGLLSTKITLLRRGRRRTALRCLYLRPKSALRAWIRLLNRLLLSDHCCTHDEPHRRHEQPELCTLGVETTLRCYDIIFGVTPRQVIR